MKYTLLKSTFLSFFLYLTAQGQQQSLKTVDQMPNLPQPYKIIDFKELAHQFDKKVYDFNEKGEYWPLVWIDKSHKNFNQDVIGMYTAMGDVRQGLHNNEGKFHESLATMGAALGASLVGIDKSNQNGYNYISMLKNYFNSETGWNIMMNNTAPEVALLGGGYGRDWWYDVFPNVLFYAIYDLYPNEPEFEKLAKIIADKFYEADKILNGNYNYSYFDYGKMQPMTNHICAQPDAAAGHAYVLYSAYKKFGDKKYLDGAISSLRALEAQKENPTYELLMPFGAYVAARLEAEHQIKFDIKKLLDFSFDGTPKCREGWGVLTGNWNGFDISGIVGSTVHNGGYGFLMNTYDFAWPIVPIAKYDQSYANIVGKWMLNAANSAKLFYPQYIPKEHQTIPELEEHTKGVIGYEGLIKKSLYEKTAHLKAPVAHGDGPLWVPGKNPDVSQFSVYGSGHVGIFGSIIKETNVKGILELNLQATDFFKSKSYPSYLYYNPYNQEKTISIQLPKKEKLNLYNTVNGEFIKKNTKGKTTITIPANSSVIVVSTPAKGKISYNGNQMLVDNIVVDYKVKK